MHAFLIDVYYIINSFLYWPTGKSPLLLEPLPVPCDPPEEPPLGALSTGHAEGNGEGWTDPWQVS